MFQQFHTDKHLNTFQIFFILLNKLSKSIFFFKLNKKARKSN